MLDWKKHDPLLISLIERYGQQWSRIIKYMPPYITISAARNRWQRINNIQPGKNKCKYCRKQKRGHTVLQCYERLSDFDDYDKAKEYEVKEYEVKKYETKEHERNENDVKKEESNELNEIVKLEADNECDKALQYDFLLRPNVGGELEWDYSALQYDFFLWPHIGGEPPITPKENDDSNIVIPLHLTMLSLQ